MNGQPVPPPGSAAAAGELMRIGAADAALHAPVEGAGDQLPEGVLPRTGWDVSTAIGVIAIGAISEAAFNLGQAVYTLLHLPLLLAVLFPVVAEATALTFAVQDLRDRRRGVASRALRAATYLTLIASSAVNGIVGWAQSQAGGLLEVLPPLVLGAVIHLHGDRATRAHQTRARLSPRWRAEQLRAAQLESVVEVLPLLAGDTHHGRATVALLQRRLQSHTLEPGEALIAAGWHQRDARAMPADALLRLETVAATVWGRSGPPAPAPAPWVGLTSARGTAPRSTSTPAATSAPTSAPGPVSGPARTSAPGAVRPRRAEEGAEVRSADAATLAALVATARRSRPNAGEGSVRALLRESGLSSSDRKIRAALAAAGESPAPLEAVPAAPHLQVVPAPLPEQAPVVDLVELEHEPAAGQARDV